jgi:AcrR family transcriptional regulator
MKRSLNNESSSARDILLVAARRLFARKGLSGTTIRDIALEAKMNSSQISYYFENKEGLYRACVQDIAEDRIRIAEQILIPPQSAEEYRVRLQLFADNLFNYFLEDRDTGLIIIREYDRMHSPAEKVFKNYFSQLFDLLINFFRRAITKGFTTNRGLAADKGDPLIITSLFFGTLISELRFDHIKEGLFKRSLRHAEERKIVTEHIVNLFS